MGSWDNVLNQIGKEYQKAPENTLNKRARSFDGKSKTSCTKCGAPVISEICPYCGTVIDIDTADSFLEYPVMECKTAALNKVLMIVLITATIVFIGSIISSVIPMLGIMFIALSSAGEEALTLDHIGFPVLLSLLTGLPLFLLGCIPGYFAFRHYRRYRIVMNKGKRLKGIVYGYMDDIVLVNHAYAQIVKILVQTETGPKFILYPTGKTEKPYRVNIKVELMVYEGFFIILGEY